MKYTYRSTLVPSVEYDILIGSSALLRQHASLCCGSHCSAAVWLEPPAPPLSPDLLESAVKLSDISMTEVTVRVHVGGGGGGGIRVQKAGNKLNDFMFVNVSIWLISRWIQEIKNNVSMTIDSIWFVCCQITTYIILRYYWNLYNQTQCWLVGVGREK